MTKIWVSAEVPNVIALHLVKVKKEFSYFFYFKALAKKSTNELTFALFFQNC